MNPHEKSNYPTDEQMKEMWEALESRDDQKVLAVLQKRLREYAKKESSAKNSQAAPN